MTRSIGAWNRRRSTEIKVAFTGRTSRRGEGGRLITRPVNRTAVTLQTPSHGHMTTRPVDTTSSPGPATIGVLSIGRDPSFKEGLKALTADYPQLRLRQIDSIHDEYYRRCLVESDLVVLDTRGDPDVATEYLRRSRDLRIIRPTLFLTDDDTTFHTQVEAVGDMEGLGDAIARFEERSNREHTIAESERMFMDLFEMTGDAVFIHEPGGMFIAVNREACESLGYTREELLRLHPEDIDCPISANKVVERTQRLLDEGQVEFEAYHRRKDGSMFPVEIVLRQFTYMGKPAVIADVRDVSERRDAQESLRKANEKLKLLGAITRHDISNRLASIMGHMELSGQVGVPEDLRAQYMQKARESLDAIGEQLRFTGDYQKAGTSESVWTNVGHTIDAVADVFDLGSVSISPELHGLEIRADPLVERVFWNLLDNAKRHGERVTEVRFGLERIDGDIVIVAEDNGTGVPGHEKARIFEPGHGKHTGMGLFLVREILAITGITISETGEHGKGARFEIRVPRGTHRAAPPST